MSRVRRWLSEPLDSLALAMFRIAFGLTVSVGALRFLVYGWVDTLYAKPTFFFKYWGFEWVQVASPSVMRGAYAVLAVLGLCVAAGLWYRVTVVAAFVLFGYLELTDVTNYLNHYYLVSLLLLLMCVLPLHRRLSLDAWMHARRARAFVAATLPAWHTYLLRFQVGVVYVFAAVAKMNSDWLVHGQPLNVWLSSRTETPVIGPLLALPFMPLVMSWLGFLNDLLIVPFFLWRRTRPWAYAWVVVFHVLTSMLFSIGMFPYIMMASATVFLSSDWPLRAYRVLRGWASVAGVGERVSSWGSVPDAASPALRPVSRRVVAALCVYCALQVVVPLRGFLYAGPVNWHEQGMRFSWRVMVREKNGSVVFRVRFVDSGRVWYVSPSEYLTHWQEREMSGQPDMILQLAHHVERQFARRGKRVQVFADAQVSLNGRRARAIIDPRVDLTRVRDGLRRAEWILPFDLASEPPIELKSVSTWSSVVPR